MRYKGGDGTACPGRRVTDRRAGADNQVLSGACEPFRHAVLRPVALHDDVVPSTVDEQGAHSVSRDSEHPAISHPCPASDCVSEIRVIIRPCFPGVWDPDRGLRMSDHGNGRGRRRKRMLSAQEKYQDLVAVADQRGQPARCGRAVGYRSDDDHAHSQGGQGGGAGRAGRFEARRAAAGRGCRAGRCA